MGLEQEQIKEQLSIFAGKVGPKTILPATVTAVNDDDTIAIEFSDGSTVDDARLRSVVKAGNKVLLIPKVESIVLVAKIENSDEYIVVAIEEITDVKYLIDSVQYEVSSAGFLIQKDADTLKDALVTFVEAVEAIIVMQGRNPDRLKLATAKEKIQNILR